MARTKSVALKKLVDRNLTERKVNAHGELKRKKLTKSEKKARQQRRDFNKQQQQLSEKQPSSLKKKTKAPVNTAELTEIENLKNEIAKELNTRVTYVKRQSRVDTPLGWEGLTPGLAPVGYEPDASDSDEDPY